MNFPSLPNFPPRRLQRGMTLIELLTVLAILTVLLSVIVPTLPNLLIGSPSYRAADVVLRSAAYARQCAVSYQHPVALVVSRPSAASSLPQAVMLMEAIPPQGTATTYTWRAITGWTPLPDSVNANALPRERSPEEAATASFYGSETMAAANLALPTPLPLRFQETNVTDYLFILFHPNGTVLSPTPSPALGIRHSRRSTADDQVVLISSETGSSRLLRF